MIHFFVHFSHNPDRTPFGAILRRIGVPHRIFGDKTRQEYPRRWQLLLLGYPRLAWAALKRAFASLLGAAGPPPDVVVLSSDVEVLIFALVRTLPGAARPAIVMMPFIFTARAASTANRLRMAYYRFVLRRVRLAICHSSLELGRYRALFQHGGTEFAFVRWGSYVPPMAEIMALPGPGGASRPIVFSAGRSGRHYACLIEAAAPLPCEIVIVCNDAATLQGVPAAPNLTILRDTADHAYLRQLLRADIVVVPLRVADISAGQMVVIQAMALARPLVVTDTPTIRDYLHDGRTAILVPQGDVAALRAAIGGLLADPARATALGQAAAAEYAARFTNEACLREMLGAVARLAR